MADEGLVEGIRAALHAVADPAKAEPMRAYMKSAMPFLGVPTPERTRALRPVLAAHPIADPEQWRGTVRTLWREATYREERYAALAVAHRHPAHLAAEPPASLELLDELVVTGAWCDLVDDTAIRLIGRLLLAEPGVVAPAMRRWARDADWVRTFAATHALSPLSRREALKHL